MPSSCTWSMMSPHRGDFPAGSGRTPPFRSKGVLAPAVVGSSGWDAYRRVLLVINDIGARFSEPVDDHGIDRCHRVQFEAVEEISLLLPEGSPAPGPLQGGLKQGRAELLGLVDQEGQHHQHHEVFAEMLFAQ